MPVQIVNPYSNQPGVAKYHSIAQDLRRRIEDGSLAPGERLPSYAAYKKLGLSQTTVEKAYLMLEADGLIERTSGSGVYVKTAGLSVPTKSIRTGLVGLATYFSGGMDYFGQPLEDICLQAGAREALQSQSMHLTLLNTEQDNHKVLQRLDGILTTETSLECGNLPCVHCLSEGSQGSSVIADEELGVTLAVRHLLELGHRRIGYLIAPHENFQRRRMGAYQKALAEAGIEPQLRWVRHMYWIKQNPTRFAGSAFNRMTEWLTEDWKEVGCTALLCQNDQAALGAIEALHEWGLRVPEDVSVVGFDGSQAANLLRPHLTTVHMPLAEMGRKAVELLLEAMSDAPAPRTTVVLPTHLEVGQSTGPNLRAN